MLSRADTHVALGCHLDWTEKLRSASEIGKAHPTCVCEHVSRILGVTQGEGACPVVGQRQFAASGVVPLRGERPFATTPFPHDALTHQSETTAPTDHGP